MLEKLTNIEELNFKIFQDSKNIPYITEYIRDWFQKNPDGRIAVGTDSQRRKKYLVYVSVISLFYPGNKGAHLIYCRNRFKLRKIDLWTRLWQEVEATRAIAEYIRNAINKPIEVHIDLNPDAEYQSNKVFAAAVGYLKSFEFEVIAKPGSCVASHAADLLAD